MTREVFSRRYASFLPDGSLWCESSDPEEVVQLSFGRGCTYSMLVTYLVREKKHWTPLECVNAQCSKHYNGPKDWDCKAVNP